MRLCKYLTILGGLLFCTGVAVPQTVRTLYEQVKKANQIEDYARVVKLCQQIIARCEQSKADAECWFTNVMKNVYRYKGFAEYQYYQKNSDLQWLDEAISSLMKSYELFNDPEVSYNFGYMQTLRALHTKTDSDFEGLVNTWRGILGLYAQDEWIVSPELVKKLKIFIQQAAGLAEISRNSLHSTGAFANFMIRLACDLAEKNKLSRADSLFFNRYRQHAIDGDYNFGESDWRALGLKNEKVLNDSTGSRYKKKEK